jgi:protein-S-isoprenylcysteine O-methyltransferase Ste14
MLAFCAFLFAGPPGLIDFDMGLPSVLAVNASLSLLFFAQHSGMVRRSFKAWLTRFVPDCFVAAIFSIASGVALFVVVFGWQESPYVIASATGSLLWTLRIVFVLGIAGLVWGAAALGGFDSLGLKPIRDRLETREARSSRLAIRGPYRWVRHPLYLFVILMIWAYPQLTIDRLLFNVLWTAWIFVGSWLEEHDLVAEFGEQYRAYQRRVPMLIPYRIPDRSSTI